MRPKTDKIEQTVESARTNRSRESIFLNHSISEIQDAYAKGHLSPTEVATDCVQTIRRFEDRVKAWVCVSEETLLSRAREAEERIERGDPLRALEGMPIGVKDVFNTCEFPTEMGSPIWKGFTPGNDARCLYYVKNQGGIVFGKTVTAEFAVHTLGKTLNPHDLTRTPGTSSSGSAVAVAVGMVPVALGTQTAGSIVRPASFSGVYGCKPSFGLIPRTGMLKTTDSLDTVGFFVTHFEDMRRVFDTLRVHGSNYPFSHRALSDTKRQHRASDRPWRVALVRSHTWEHAHDYSRKALLEWAEQLTREAGIEVVEAKLPPEMERAHEIHATIYNKTLSYYFSKEFDRSELVSPIMNDLIRDGNSISVERYHRALQEQAKLARAMDAFFKEYHILVSLSTAGHAPLREEMERPDTALMWTMAHLPVISAPVFTSPSGLPFGVQLVARRYNDYLLFQFASHLHSSGFIPRGGSLVPGRRNPSQMTSQRFL